MAWRGADDGKAARVADIACQVTDISCGCTGYDPFVKRIFEVVRVYHAGGGRNVLQKLPVLTPEVPQSRPVQYYIHLDVDGPLHAFRR